MKTLLDTEGKAKFWVKIPWKGNPSLNLDCFVKYFPMPLSKHLVPVYVWGNGTDIHYTVDAGNDSDYSYTGSFYPRKLNIHQCLIQVDELFRNKKLII
jgi:hypothetical protein